MPRPPYKKGFMADSAILLVLMFIFIILFVVGAYVSTAMKGQGLGGQFDAVMNAVHNGEVAFNTLAPFFILANGLALMLSALLIRSIPAVFAIFFVIQVIIAVVSIQFSNAYFQIFTGNALSAEAGNFTLWAYVFQWFPIVSVVLSIILGIAAYAKGGE